MSEEIGTPKAVRELEDAIRRDLAEVTALFVEGVSRLERLGESIRMLPASQSRMRGWQQSVEIVVGNIAEEQADVSRKLLGGETQPIESAVDHAHLEVVRAAKENEEAA